MKVCVECNETKQLTEFYKQKSKPDGYNIYCKVCWKNRCAIQDAKNPNYYREQYNKTKERHSEYMKQWRNKNPDKANAITHEYRHTLPPGVYMVQNDLEPNKFYIGSSKTPQARKSAHFSKHSNPKCDSTSPTLQADMNRLGREHFSFHLLHECSIDELFYWEKFYKLICQPYYNNMG